MNNLAKNLRFLLDREGMSENTLGERTGVPQPTINRILRGESRDPRDSTIRPLAKFFGVGLEDLKTTAFHGTGAVPMLRKVVVHAYDVDGVDGDEGFDAEKEVWVDAVEVELSGGPGIVMPEYVPTKYRQRYTLKWFKDMGANPDSVKVMAVRGQSMEPTLYETDRVAVNLAADTIQSGKVYALIMGGECRIKRLFRTADGSIRIVSDNPDKTRYPDEVVGDDLAGFKVLGRVIERKGTGGL